MHRTFKKIIVLALIAHSINAHALSNYWQHVFGQGYDIYHTDIDAKTYLAISCGEGANAENSVYIYNQQKNKIFKTSEYNLFEFVIDEQVYPIPSKTDTMRLAASWISFIEAIKGATHFTVYIDGKRLLNAHPSLKNATQVFFDIDCKPKASWD